MKVKTIKVVNGEGFILINESDFIEGVHETYLNPSNEEDVEVMNLRAIQAQLDKDELVSQGRALGYEDAKAEIDTANKLAEEFEARAISAETKLEGYLKGGNAKASKSAKADK